MPLFYQHSINESAKLGIWRITEPEEFFLKSVPLQREITHPHKRLQHLAGRYLLQFLFDDFPYELIKIADTRKPFLLNEAYHFSISHCGDYAAAIVSNKHRVGIDIEIPTIRMNRIQHKFLSKGESGLLAETGNAKHRAGDHTSVEILTVLWSAKEAVFKWFGNGGVDFSEDILIQSLPDPKMDQGEIPSIFMKITPTHLKLHYQIFEGLCLVWVIT